ncbi:hypothetical protein NE237_026769 [Protea cynaroides]|uniref:Uncharacterized protein n=1 Tax=Protea cynaroides TaxID=273540 RepID=A0A9Q0JQS3_9MAGN|nr:hypothetical protein NE237_026769 [Protea cynaroides]
MFKKVRDSLEVCRGAAYFSAREKTSQKPLPLKPIPLRKRTVLVPISSTVCTTRKGDSKRSLLIYATRYVFPLVTTGLRNKTLESYISGLKLLRKANLYFYFYLAIKTSTPFLNRGKSY